MSRYKGNDEKCPHCGIKYRLFRTGFTYREVKLMAWDNSDDPKQWTYKRRGTVLGRWHAIKQELWAKHISTGCPEYVPF